MATGAFALETGSGPEPIQTLLPVEGFEGRQTHEPSFPSDPQALEWEAKVQTWLAGMPTRRNVTASEMDEWINSNPSSLPESLRPLPRSQLHARILSLHKLLRGSATNQGRDDKGSGEQPQPRFVRTDQWMPVYSWLETLETDEVVKSKQISEWLAENSKVKDQLFARHSRYHLMHYIQKLHLKMLRRKEKLKQGSHSVQTPSPATATLALKAINIAVAVPETQLPRKSPGDGFKDEDVHVSRKNEALLRYELLTDLQNQLAIILAKHKRSSSSKESGSTPLTRQESLEKSPIEPLATGVGIADSVPGAASLLDLKSGKKRKVSTEERAPALPYSEAGMQPPVLSAVSDAA